MEGVIRKTLSNIPGKDVGWGYIGETKGSLFNTGVLINEPNFRIFFIFIGLLNLPLTQIKDNYLSYFVLELCVFISEFSCLCYPLIFTFRKTLQEYLSKKYIIKSLCHINLLLTKKKVGQISVYGPR